MTNEKIRTNFAESIRNIRKQNSLTQAEMAEKIGTTQSQYYLWESGKSSPSTETLCKVSSLFGVSVDTLIGNEPKKKAKNSCLAKVDGKIFCRGEDCNFRIGIVCCAGKGCAKEKSYGR